MTDNNFLDSEMNKQFVIIQIDLWSDRLLGLISNKMIETLVAGYEEKPQGGRLSISDVTKLLNHQLSEVEEYFGSTRYRLTYSDEEQRIHFINNVISLTLKKLGADSGFFWTTEENDLLKKLFEEGKTDEQIAKILKRTVGAVISQRKSPEMRLLRKEDIPDWSNKEVELLKRNLRIGYTPKQILDMNLLFRTIFAIEDMVRKLDLSIKDDKAYQWTDEEIEVLRTASERNYTDQDIAEQLERPEWQIVRQRVLMGDLLIYKNQLSEDKLILRLYGARFSMGEIAQMLDVKKGMVRRIIDANKEA